MDERTPFTISPKSERLRRNIVQSNAADKYIDFLNNSITPVKRNVAGGTLDNVWFQQDGAQEHFALVVRNLLNTYFPGKWSGRRGTIEWLPRSTDLTSLDFFYWGYLKSKVYETKPNNKGKLKQRIVTLSESITPELLQKVSDEVYLRLALCQEKEGYQFEQDKD